MVRDLMLCLQEVALEFVRKKYRVTQQVAECFENPPCGCINPGKELQCEDCSHLESCLSNLKAQGFYN
ncbi:hypothetical protein NIES37_17550 [Tolypothrix tenuis PCC 7101]|uniref:Uncharacterized protein n=1 Tax=Tolypothrix tenuis PCC 7101 TaxID=231146 RepID=A0A1Z4MWL2_9CYAN|nr:hypothetical protein NIES37_17550 [Tolypothrix tenuis PCC 7101]BAZ71683.1 hypothetical protein NIES50_02290 [Aulosira laxa NIES-50]